MLKIFFAVGTALTLLFGALGVGAAAVQNSQPGEPLHTLKEWREPLHFRFQEREQVQMQALNGPAQNVSDPGLQNQLRSQNQEMSQAQQLNNPTATDDQVRDRLRLQTQDRLHTQDCMPDPQGSAAQHQSGGPHEP